MPRRLIPILALVLASACATVPPREARFTILQVNDVYKIEGLAGGQKGGLARLRTLRTQLEAKGAPVLVLHGGDVLYPSVMSKYHEARPMVDVMNLLDGDAGAFDDHLVVGLGNHELDNGDARILLDRMRDSQFHWLATNTKLCETRGHCSTTFPSAVPTAKELLVLEVGGTKVGLFGVLYPVDRGYAASGDVQAAARAAVDALHARGARVVIAITHEEMGADVELVRAVPGIDLVIGGHDHLFAEREVNGVWIGKADADIVSALVYDVVVPPTGPIRTRPQRVVVDGSIAKDPVIEQRVDTWLDSLAEKLGGDEPLATTTELLEGTEPAIRGRETALGNLLADVARAQMGTDVALLNGGGIRINDDIPPGPVTNYEMEGIFYYTNRLVAFELTGSQLLEMLRNSVSRVDAGDGRFLQVSGVTFRYRKGAGGYEVEDVSVGGRPLDPDGRYTAATTDFLYERGIEDGYQLFTDANRPAKVHEDREIDFRTAVERWLREKGTVSVAVEGRIVRADTP